MFLRVVIFLFSFCCTVEGADLNLKSLPDDGSVEVFIQDIDTVKFFIQFQGIEQYKNVLVAEKKSGQFEKYDFSPLFFEGFKLYKTSKKTVLSGSVVVLYELYLPGKKVPIKLRAIESKNLKDLKSIFELENRKILNDKNSIVGLLNKNCGSVITVKNAKLSEDYSALNGVLSLCSKDEDYKSAIKSRVKEISFKSSKSAKPKYSLKKGVLRVKHSKHLYNADFSLIYWLENNL